MVIFPDKVFIKVYFSSQNPFHLSSPFELLSTITGKKTRNSSSPHSCYVQPNVYGLSKASNYTRQKLMELQRKTHKLTITNRDCSTYLSKVNRSNKQKISKNIFELNIGINQLDTLISKN